MMITQKKPMILSLPSFCLTTALCLMGLAVQAADGPVQPDLPEALRFAGLDQMRDNAETDLRTSGVNHVLGQGTLPQDVSTLNLDFGFSFEFNGASFNHHTPSCGSGCRLQRSADTLRVVKGQENLIVEQSVVIYRFAKAGDFTLSDGTNVDWLVRMVEGDTLRGFLRQPLDEDGVPTFPGELELDGRMIITLQVKGEDPVNLMSVQPSRLTGAVTQWPPAGTQFSLQEDVPYYDVADLQPAPNGSGGVGMVLANANVQPVIVVTANDTSIGFQKSAFLSTLPEIDQTWVAHNSKGLVAGLGLSWQDTSSQISGPKTCPAQQYQIYRNDDPGNLDGWRLIAQVPATVTTYVDASWDGTSDAEYMVLNGSIFKFGYTYEGSPGYATLVESVH